ncbi:MAG: hypothetical protein GVY07_03710 [Bacteroidetes bacterium]|jgi:hypothetical protein|nr:hypothetical protein [Bacteroidota bacterium]
MKIAKNMLLLSSGFAGGFLAGCMISTIQTTDQFQSQRKRVETAISRFTRVLNESQERLSEVNIRLKREFRHPIPDLYRATESLSLDENELIYD